MWSVASLGNDNSLRDSIPLQTKVSWVSYNIRMERDKSTKVRTNNACLPVIDHPSNDIDFQVKVMKMNIDFTNFINPSQVPVGCSDQPLYALKKKIMWSYPSKSPSNAYFAFLGGSHIEQQCFSLHGELIGGTGLEDIVKQGSLSIIGL